jgi:hypothetical protein
MILYSSSHQLSPSTGRQLTATKAACERTNTSINEPSPLPKPVRDSARRGTAYPSALRRSTPRRGSPISLQIRRLNTAPPLCKSDACPPHPLCKSVAQSLESNVTAAESKKLVKGNRVCWRRDAADSGTIIATSWNAVTIAWDNGQVATVHHGDMREIHSTSAKPKSV